MARTKKVKKEEEVKSPVYTVTLVLNGETTTLQDETIVAALKSFVGPDLVKNGLDISVSKGEKTVTRTYQSFQARRLLWNSAALEILAGDLTDELG